MQVLRNLSNGDKRWSALEGWEEESVIKQKGWRLQRGVTMKVITTKDNGGENEWKMYVWLEIGNEKENEREWERERERERDGI